MKWSVIIKGALVDVDQLINEGYLDILFDYLRKYGIKLTEEHKNELINDYRYD